MLRRFRRFVNGVDRTVGRIVWTGAAVALCACAAWVAYVGVVGFWTTEGGERWAVLALSLAFSALCLAFARQAAGRRDLSQALDDS